MTIEIREEPISLLAEYAHVPIAFTVGTVLDVTVVADEFVLSERPLDTPYVKDYDAIPGEGPTRWADRFNLTNVGVLAAYSNGQRIGGVAIAFNTEGLDPLEGRKDLAILWDIRVAPEWRGQGVGSALFRAAETWARTRSSRELKVETQNINVPACNFYARQGCVLRAINRFAYRACPEEIQLLWYKDLG